MLIQDVLSFIPIVILAIFCADKENDIQKSSFLQGWFQKGAFAAASVSLDSMINE